MRKDPNLICTQLYLQAREVRTADTLAVDARTLYIHADLASSENRNRFVIGFFGLLVLHGWYDVVEFGSHLEYHSWGIADSEVFAPLKVHVTKRALHTPIDVLERAQASYVKTTDELIVGGDGQRAKRKAVDVVWMEGQLDWKTLLEASVSTFTNISKYRAFSVSKGV